MSFRAPTRNPANPTRRLKIALPSPIPYPLNPALFAFNPVPAYIQEKCFTVPLDLEYNGDPAGENTPSGHISRTADRLFASFSQDPTEHYNSREGNTMYSAYLKHIILACIILLAFACCEAGAYWPTTLEENLAVSADPDTGEIEPLAIYFTDGSTLVVFHKQWYGYVYQIIDKYGDFWYSQPQYLTPANPSFDMQAMKLIPDANGGAIISWDGHNQNPMQGICAQRLDSLGNLMWGDSGKVVFPIEETDFDICTDGAGGFFLAISPDEEAMDHSDLYMQHMDSEGNLPWGQEGVLISDLPSESERYPKVAYCSLGGAYVIWEDHRPPYNIWGALFAQRIDENGSILWTNDLFICEHVWFHQVIPDSEGGFLLHTNPGAGDDNTVYRVSSGGNILWEREDVSWYNHAKIVPGESGYFYLGFTYYEGVYGQKMDLEGNTYWPVFGSLQGAQMSFITGIWHNMHEDWFYSSPYFYGVFDYNREGNYPFTYYAQKLNRDGDPQWREDGVILTTINEDNYWYQNGIEDGSGGLVLVYELTDANDVYAKHCDDEGRLGGALHLWIDMEPQNPPIQIPPGGGSFQFNVAIEDTYIVESIFDAWIEVTLPNGEDLEILHRDNITIQANSVIERFNIIQNVPAGAPSGTYTYHFFVGNHEHDDIWSEDSLTFEKLPGEGDYLSSSENWNLSGFFDELSDESLLKAEEVNPDNYELLSVYPSPFNNSTTLEFVLSAASPVRLAVFDISGRLVEVLVDGYKQPGSYETVWQSDNHASGIYFVKLDAGENVMTKKIILIK